MSDHAERTMPVAIWVASIGFAEQACVSPGGFICDKSANIRAVSSDGRFKVNFPFGPLGGELLDRFTWLMNYGLTVVDMPEDWTSEYRRPSSWLDELVNKALNRVLQRKSLSNEVETPAMYDEVLANAVLASIAPKHPHAVNMVEIKSALKDNEPSDDELLTALQALHMDGLITGEAIRDHTTGKRKLLAMMKINVTKEGRQHLAGTSAGQHQAVVHQYNNFGQAGAMGPNSVGTINYQQQWEAIRSQVDLSGLAEEIGRTIKQQTPSTSEDYQKLALLSEAKEHAEKHDGGRFMETITKMGEAALPVLARAGATGMVSYLEHKYGLKL